MRCWLAGAALFWVTGALGSACASDKGGAPSSPCDETTKSHAPYCGSPCVAKCGCRSCSDGELLEQSGSQYVCQGGCYKPLSVSNDAGDASASDAAPDVDCSGVTCAPAAICGQCSAPCGCCECQNFELTAIDGGAFICSNGCFIPVLEGGT